MKIVSWNANGAFRRKFKEILDLDADIYVVQESENPDKISDDPEFRRTVRNGFWVGCYNHKGLLVFSTNPELRLAREDWHDRGKRYFIPIRVNDGFTLVGAWACDPYCEELHDWLEEVGDKIKDDCVILGDLNSNVNLDPKHLKVSGKSYSKVLERLAGHGLYDIWHHHHKEEQGKESVPTFYLYRHLDKPYHIDHCLASPTFVKNMSIHSRWKWLSMSDHLPIEIELNIENK